MDESSEASAGAMPHSQDVPAGSRELPTESGSTTLLEKIAAGRDSFGRAERRLADFISAAPAAVPQMSLAALARGAQVSDPTVIRFCRKLGCAGYPQFKIRLVQDLAAGRPYVPQEVDFNDTLPDIRDKVLGSNIHALRSLSASLSNESLENAIERILSSERVLICAEGLTSALVAADLHRKFIFLGLPAVFHAETPLQVIAAAGLKSRDVVIATSLTGYNKHVIRCAKLAVERGAGIIGITRSNTMISSMSDILLPVDTIENVYWYTQIATRLAHLAVFDILATGLALRRGPSVREMVRNLKEATGPWRTDL